jgi:hypothetical protein
VSAPEAAARVRKRAMRRRVGISDDGGIGSYYPYVYNPWRGGLSRECKCGVLGDKKSRPGEPDGFRKERST